MSRDRPVIKATSSPSGEFPSRTRSAVTNHKDLLPGLDGRSATARRFRDLVNAFVADMGGLDRCSQIKLGLVRRLAATTVQAEMLEARMVNGEAIDIATLCTLASTTVRLWRRQRLAESYLGLVRGGWLMVKRGPHGRPQASEHEPFCGTGRIGHETDRPGTTSRCGDEMMRSMLYEAAQTMLLRSAK
jgi:hypothetical protein